MPRNPQMEAEVAGANATVNAIVQARYSRCARERDGLASPCNDLHAAAGRQGHPQRICRPWRASTLIPAGVGAEKLQAGKVDNGALEVRIAVVALELEARRARVDCAQQMAHPRMPASLPMSDAAAWVGRYRAQTHPAFLFAIRTARSQIEYTTAPTMEEIAQWVRR